MHKHILLQAILIPCIGFLSHLQRDGSMQRWVNPMLLEIAVACTTTRPFYGGAVVESQLADRFGNLDHANICSDR